jgi:hypothetical protein
MDEERIFKKMNAAFLQGEPGRKQVDLTIFLTLKTDPNYS